MSNISPATWGEALAKVRTHARVGVHFHPDRPDSGMKTVAESLLETGLYQSQFETQMSNGGVSAYPGGPRYQRETRLFGGAYDSDEATSTHRPKYGALELMRHPDGPAPRFGGCYLLLKPAVSRRCSFTYLDSHYDPKEKGTFDEFEDIAAALLSETFVRQSALGEKNLTPVRLVHHLLTKLETPIEDPLARAPSRNLDHYIEAQVHGDLVMQEDVEVLVADPSFKSTETGRVLENICTRYGVALRWHGGFVMAVENVPSDFRGPAMPSLARRIAEHGYVDVSLIGKAAMSLKRTPAAWSDRGNYADVLQELKLLWHVLVKFGTWGQASR